MHSATELCETFGDLALHEQTDQCRLASLQNVDLEIGTGHLESHWLRPFM